MRLRGRETLTCAVLATGAAACRQQATPSPRPDPKQVIATYAFGQFLREEVTPDLERRLGRDPAARTPEGRSAMLRGILERRARIELLYREAMEKGLAEGPEMKTLLERDQEALLADDWLDRHVTSGVEAAPARIDEEVARRTQSAPEELRRFSHIFLKAPEADAEARRRAQATMATIRKELADGKSFEELARSYSDSITARGGGQVEWTAQKPLHPAAAQVVFALSEGQVSEPVATESGLHLFRLDGIRRPTQPVAATLREEVKRALDDEARRAALEAERARAFDESGVRLDARALARPGAPDAVVAVVGKDTIQRRDLDLIHRSSPTYQAMAPADLAKRLVVDRILAGRRRGEPIDAGLQAKLDQARKARLVEARRSELVAGIAKDVTPQEEADFYARNRDAAPFLKEYTLDFVFFEQQGPSAAAVYAEGEKVSHRLRAGESFEAILDSLGGRSATVVRKRVPHISMDALRAENDRVAKTLAQLPLREVSRALYLEGKPVTFGQPAPIISGKGVIFFRALEVAPVPLARVREQVREAIRSEKERQGIAGIQQELNQRTGLKILVPEG